VVRRRVGRAGSKAAAAAAAVVAAAGGSEWFYPEGPALPFSAGTGAAASFSPAMAFTFAAFCYMLALLLTAALIFFAIWHVSSWGRKREGEAAPPQPRVAADPRSALLRPRRSASRDGAGRCARSRPARRRSDAPPGPGAGRAR
jgi:hypothetical protein